MKRGQSSVEFLTILSFIFLMIIPLILVFIENSTDVRDSISVNHIRNIAVRLVDKSETMYYLGGTSKTTVKALFPNNIEFVNITHDSITFTYNNARNKLQYITIVSAVNLTGNISNKPGIHAMEIISEGDEVSVRDT
jgi:hypothetical protein